MMALGMASEPADRAVVHVIDDDDGLRRALERLFRSVGLETMVYPTARDFLDTRPPGVPGCIVLDVRLPGINGLSCRRSWESMASACRSC